MLAWASRLQVSIRLLNHGAKTLFVFTLRKTSPRMMICPAYCFLGQYKKMQRQFLRKFHHHFFQAETRKCKRCRRSYKNKYLTKHKVHKRM